MAVCVNYLVTNFIWPRKLLEITLNVGNISMKKKATMIKFKR